MKHFPAVLFLAAVATPTLAVDRYKVEAVLSKDGDVIESFTDVVESGVTTQFERKQIRQIVSTFYGGKDDRPDETSPLTTGVVFKATPKALQEGVAQINFELTYTEIIKNRKSEFDGVMTDLPVTSQRTFGNSFIVLDSEPPAPIKDGSGDLSLSITVTKQ